MGLSVVTDRTELPPKEATMQLTINGHSFKRCCASSGTLTLRRKVGASWASATPCPQLFG